MADAFERRPEVGEVLAVEASSADRGASSRSSSSLLEIQRDVGLAVRFGDQQLFVDVAAAGIERARELGDR